MTKRLKHYTNRRRFTELFLHITGTRNNVIVCLMTRGGLVFGTWSMGYFGFQGYKKTTRASGALFGVYLGDRLRYAFDRIRENASSLHIVVHGQKSFKHFSGFLDGLRTARITLYRATSRPRVCFNGSRRRVQRRV